MIRRLREALGSARATHEKPFDGRIPAPSMICLATTLWCNLKCRMCLPYLSGNTVKGPHMDLDLFHRIADQVFPFVRRFQPSVAGEPTMSRGFMEMVKKAVDHGVKLEMTTNATLMSSPRLKSMVPSIGIAVVSFDGATKQTFESIRHGAKFERVVQNVKNLIAMGREMPESERPRVTFNCVIMKRNVHELPAIVRLAHELGVSVVSFSHVYPETEEFKQESLVHHQELGRRYIAEAIAEAERLGQSLNVAPLDQLTAATAMGEGVGRQLAIEDGVVEGFEHTIVNPPDAAPMFRFHPDRDASAEVRERRAVGRSRHWYLSPGVPKGAPGPPEAAWTCDYLWNRLYVGVKGLVTPCCVNGVPVVDRVDDGTDVDVVWNNRILRSMRQRLVARNPAPICRGCKHIREVTDAAEIQRLTGGRPVPSEDELDPLPETLLPESAHVPFDPERLERDLAQDDALPWGGEWPADRDCETTAIAPDDPDPVLRWKGRRGRPYRVEFSADAFETIVYSSEELDAPELSLAGEVWNSTVAGTYAWRVWLLEQPERIVWQGLVTKRAPTNQALNA